jgi:hypothetical protein
MGWPADKQQDQGWLARLRDHRVHMKLWPVKRGDGIGHGHLLGQRQRVEAANMHQTRGPGQAGRDEQDGSGQRDRRYHITTVNRDRRRRSGGHILAGAGPGIRCTATRPRPRQGISQRVPNDEHDAPRSTMTGIDTAHKVRLLLRAYPVGYKMWA